MRKLEEHSAGFYSPSPGMIYPALAYLGDAGQIAAEIQGSRKRYSLTALGQARLERSRDRVEHLMERLARIGSRMDDVRDAFTGVHDVDRATTELHDARHRLKRALFSKRGCSAEESRRIAAALDRLADEILHPGEPGHPSSKDPT